MPLDIPTGVAARRPRLGRVAAIATACMAAGAVPIAIADDQPSRQARSIADPSPPAVTRYFDIEANKGNSMRALGLYMAEQRADPSSRYQDLEANKARSQRAR